MINEQETYEVGELVQVSFTPRGPWSDVVVHEAAHPWYGGTLPDGRSWSRKANSQCIRKHPLHPFHAWKVGDECEVCWSGAEWKPAIVNRVGRLRVELAPGVPCAGAYFDPEPWQVRRPAAVHQGAGPPSTVKSIIAQMSGLKHGPGGTGRNGPCDADCRKCELDRALTAARAQPTDPLDAVIDGVTLRELLARDVRNRRDWLGYPAHLPFVITNTQRSAISAYRSAELRAKIAESKERDRHQVLYCEED